MKLWTDEWTPDYGYPISSPVSQGSGELTKVQIYCATNQCFCFRYMDITISFFLNSCYVAVQPVCVEPGRDPEDEAYMKKSFSP